MNHNDRIESRVALAMLPVGATMTFVSVVAFVVVLVLLLVTLFHRPHAVILLLLWCIAAMIVAAINAVKSIETMSAFDWRPMIPVALLSVAIVMAYPGWWM